MYPFKCTKTVVDIGIAEPFRMLHITDTHISKADERDTLRKQELALGRARAFEGEETGCCEKYYRESVQFANEQHLLLVHTGDLFDFVSEKHCDMAKELLALPEDYFFAVGNHEFSQYVGEAFEDETYKMQSFEKIQAAFPKYNLRYASRIVNGVNLIALGNVYYDFTAEQLDFLHNEAAKGLPMLLFCHNPIYTPDLHRQICEGEHTFVSSLIGVPDALMQEYTDHRYRQQIATPQTRRVLRYIEQEPLIKAIFAGHLHRGYETRLPSGAMQYVTAAQYYNEARLIEIR